MIRKIKCSIPFSFDYFFHDNVYIERRLSSQTDLICCKDCGKRFAMNHSIKSILPWEDVKCFYEKGLI